MLAKDCVGKISHWFGYKNGAIYSQPAPAFSRSRNGSTIVEYRWFSHSTRVANRRFAEVKSTARLWDLGACEMLAKRLA